MNNSKEIKIGSSIISLTDVSFINSENQNKKVQLVSSGDKGKIISRVVDKRSDKNVILYGIRFSEEIVVYFQDFEFKITT